MSKYRAPILHICCGRLVLALFVASFAVPDLGFAASPSPRAATSQAPLAPVLRILSDVPLATTLVQAVDLRWASARSVYLALRENGVVELPLDPKGKTREIIAGRKTLGGFYAHHLAASSRYVFAASPILSVTWKPIGQGLRVEEYFEFTNAVDLYGDRLLILGAQRGPKREFAPDGAIAWLGTVGKKLATPKPVLYDALGPGAQHMANCGLFQLGAVRFLADGKFVVAPGVQPGIHLFDAKGKLLQTWDTGLLGIDADCAQMSEQQRSLFYASYAENRTWVNHRRTIDELLIFDAGPALLVRSVEKGIVRWELKVLAANGSSKSWQVPIIAPNEHYHLRGDVRGGRIVFLLYEEIPSGRNFGSPHLILALPPGG